CRPPRRSPRERAERTARGAATARGRTSAQGGGRRARTPAHCRIPCRQRPPRHAHGTRRAAPRRYRFPGAVPRRGHRQHHRQHMPEGQVRPAGDGFTRARRSQKPVPWLGHHQGALAVPGTGDHRPLTLPDYAGLRSEVAAESLRRDGPNELRQSRGRHAWTMLWNIVREPMLLLLLAAVAVYLLLGDRQEAIALGVSVLAVIGLTLYQAVRSERALQALRELGSPRANVVRDGRLRTVPARELVV